MNKERLPEPLDFFIWIIEVYVVVESRANSRNVDDDFEHLVAHAMSFTLESGVDRGMGNGVLRFGTLDHVMIDDDELKRYAHVRDCVKAATGFKGCSTNRAMKSKSSIGLSKQVEVNQSNTFRLLVEPRVLDRAD